MSLAFHLLRHLRRRRLLLPPLSAAFSSPTHNPNLLPPPVPTSGRSFSWSSSSGKSYGEPPVSEQISSSESLEVESDVGAEMSSCRIDESEIVGSEMISDNHFWDFSVRIVTEVLDGYHDFTGLPWWIIISTSTLALRVSLLPVLILQLKKASRIAELFPQLPPPLPPPLSGRSYRKQYLLFQKRRKELGCPSFLWNFASFSIQFPTFFLWMTSIRSMSLSNHPGFETGGMLWFQNLADYPHGITGSIFPVLIAGLHYTNIQISFQSVQLQNMRGILGLLGKYYKLYLDILSIPLLLIGFCIPQGSLVYWTTNSFFTLFQQLSLKNPYVRTKLGLPEVKPQSKTIPSSLGNIPPSSSLIEREELSLQSLSPDKLLEIALEDMASGNQEKALPLLRIAIEKDPDLARALIAMGQILCSKSSFQEAADYFERAILKIKEEDALLVLASFGAGVSHVWQGNKEEGIKHLKRIAELKEPDKPMDKACYYKGLVMLGSTLFQDGESLEALKYLRMAATYDPAVNVYVKECEDAIEKDQQK